MKSHLVDHPQGGYVELLAPAANLAVGRAAIDAGADAVYIGGPAFGARAAASNSMADINQLCTYAHLFGAKVFVTLNTLLKSDEIERAIDIAWQAYNIEVDALIIQDFALLDCALPPIPLHASTQCFNFDVDKVIALQNAGFERVVLERALSISEIRDIKSKTEVELEVFIHGAICVGYSGRCNLSAHLTNRSGNRGECAQPCRSNYDLVDAAGRLVIKDSPLLSPRDMNLSARIPELVNAGVTSLKIEGRLKDEAYVVNVVAHYNKILNDLSVKRPSYGRTIIDFTPDTFMAFNRGFTEWFFDGAKAGTGFANTLPGKHLGVVKSVSSNSFTLDTPHPLANGDGIAFLKSGKVCGVRVNKIENGTIFPLKMDGINVGMQICQTSSIKFNPSSRRVIDIDILLNDNSLSARDDYGFSATVPLATNIERATNIEKSIASIKTSLSKAGGTMFNIRSVDIKSNPIPFIPLSALNEMRRNLLDKLIVNRVNRVDKITKKPAFKPDTANYLLRSRFCILRENGMCLKTNPTISLPLHLVNNNRLLSLSFNCTSCEMSVGRLQV